MYLSFTHMIIFTSYAMLTLHLHFNVFIFISKKNVQLLKILNFVFFNAQLYFETINKISWLKYTHPKWTYKYQLIKL